MRAFKWFLSLLSLCLVPVVLAQDTCPVVIAAALEAVDTACNETTRNQLCYGNITLNATPRDGAANFEFEQAGDVVNIADVQTLQLSSFSLTAEEWGVALMQVQANLPDTLPGQNVTFLLFGDVSMTDASEQLIELPVTATDGVNVRLRPTTSASVIASLKKEQEVIATGRLADASWVRVQLEDTAAGWVSGDFLEGDIQGLLVVEPGTPVFGPMQAFYFRTGYGDAPCEAAPDSGILIQTPEGAGRITLRANDVQIELGSTVYLQAVPGEALYVNVIEGHATLTAEGRRQVVPSGTVGRVPLDENGIASGPPDYPQPYAFDRLQNLPVNSRLLVAVKVEQATAEVNIDTAIKAVDQLANISPSSGGNTGAVSDGNLPQSGSWIWTETVVRADCSPGADPVGKTYTSTFNLMFSEDYSTVTSDSFFGVYTYPRVGDFVYKGTDPAGFGSITFVFTSATTMTIEHLGNASNPDDPCSFRGMGPAVYQP